MGVTHSLLIGVSRSEKQYEIIATFVMAASSNRNTGARGRANEYESGKGTRVKEICVTA